jgi:hypothetical protein
MSQSTSYRALIAMVLRTCSSDKRHHFFSIRFFNSALPAVPTAGALSSRELAGG